MVIKLKESRIFNSERDANLFFSAQRAYEDGYRYYDIEDDESLKQEVIEDYLEYYNLSEDDLQDFLDVLFDLENRYVYGIK